MPSRSVSLRRGIRLTRLGTLLSRVLGMLRDVVTAYRFGAGGVMDALVLALRAPDLFRRLFGEGVLAATLVPRFTERLDDPQRAWRFLALSLQQVCLLALLVVTAGEVLCGAFWAAGAEPLAMQLTALLLPYVILVCAVAQLAAALQAVGRFAAPALVSCVLNLGWISACLAAPLLSRDPAAQARMLAVAVLVSGVVQVVWLRSRLASAGWKMGRAATSASSEGTGERRDIREGLWQLAPAAVALSATQINTTVDSLWAWGLTTRQALAPGAAAAIYFGERLLMLPVGVVGVATAVVLYPTLCRLAHADNLAELAAETRRRLRGIVLLALPASAGLALLARPIVQVLLERGEFQSDSTARAAAVTAAYAVGIVPIAMLPLLVRVELALGSARRAALPAAGAVAANLAAAPVSAAWAGEAGLALTTSAVAALHAAWLLARLIRRLPLSVGGLAADFWPPALAAGGMGLAVWRLAPWVSAADGAAQAWRLFLAVALGAAIHLGLARLLVAASGSDPPGEAPPT